MLCFDIKTVAACDTETAQVKRLALRSEPRPSVTRCGPTSNEVE